MNSFSLDHVGWVTNNPKLFESFWCVILGFKLIKTGELSRELCMTLFSYPGSATAQRYAHPEWSTDIEIHIFNGPQAESDRYFEGHGINHICFHTGGPGSRQLFLEQLPSSVVSYVYDNPAGWQNIFIRDFEMNWVELRETLNA